MTIRDVTHFTSPDPDNPDPAFEDSVTEGRIVNGPGTSEGQGPPTGPGSPDGMGSSDGADSSNGTSDGSAVGLDDAFRGQSRLSGLLAFARNTWRQLTSMRSALILLFLLALASMPGALLPQWALNTSKTANYILAHPFWGPLLDKLGFFAVFGSPWYAAIYLLLFTSLVGCLLPRTWEFAKTLRQPPVSTPRNLSRLPHYESLTLLGDEEQTAQQINSSLRGWRKTQRVEPDGAVSISAEKGYLREVGNLVFHLSLLGLLVAVAVGKLVGFEGSILVTTGGGFCSVAPVSYDNFRPGLLVDGTNMSPFCVQVDSFKAQYTSTGEASSFVAGIRYQAGQAAVANSGWQADNLEVNQPLRIEGQRLYLLGHGYSPSFTVTYPGGQTQTQSEPFQPTDSEFTSDGAVKFADPPGYTGDAVRAHQLAVVGIFAPTAAVSGGILTSSFPAAQNPGVSIQVYRGDLGLNSGASQSIFAIDQNQVTKGALKQIAVANLSTGQSVTLDDGSKITFTGFKEWVSLQTSYDPAEGWALVFAIGLLAGLMTSLTIRRRRVWYRIRPADTGRGRVAPPPGGQTGPPALEPSVRGPSGGRTVTVEVGGLARTDQSGYGAEFEKMAKALARSNDVVRPGKGA